MGYHDQKQTLKLHVEILLFSLLEIWDKVNFPSHAFSFHSLHTFRSVSSPAVSSSRLPPNSLKILGPLSLTTPVLIATTIFREITVPSRRYPMITSFIFFNISSSTRFGLPLFPMEWRSFFLYLSFQPLTVVLVRWLAWLI